MVQALLQSIDGYHKSLLLHPFLWCRSRVFHGSGSGGNTKHTFCGHIGEIQVRQVNPADLHIKI